MNAKVLDKIIVLLNNIDKNKFKHKNQIYYKCLKKSVKINSILKDIFDSRINDKNKINEKYMIALKNIAKIFNNIKLNKRSKYLNTIFKIN